jgi:hypothetical protein
VGQPSVNDVDVERCNLHGAMTARGPEAKRSRRAPGSSHRDERLTTIGFD